MLRSFSEELADQAMYGDRILAMATQLRGRPQSMLGADRTSRLRTLLAHAIDNVPVYREGFDGVDRTEIQLLLSGDPYSLLRRFPFSDKASLRKRWADHCDDNIEPTNCRRARTSGTTGEPFDFIVSLDHLVYLYAVSLNRALAQGFGRGTKVLAQPCAPWMREWRDGPYPAYGGWTVAEFGSDPSDPEHERHMLRRLLAFDPDLVLGSPLLAQRLVDLLTRHGARLPRVRLLVTEGERLTAAMRTQLEGFFQVPVRDMYGLKEVGTIAAQCKSQRFHIELDRLVVEIRRDDGSMASDGVAGEIVVTSLTNLAMPFIRYRTGDMGSLSSGGCPCGAAGTYLTLLAGRENGSIRLRDGTTVPAMTLIRVLRRQRECERFQIVQDEPGCVQVRVCVSESAVAQTQALSQTLQEALGAICDRLHVSVRFVSNDGFVWSPDGRKSPEFVARQGQAL
jgi:phenylacetate-CoA ligase